MGLPPLPKPENSEPLPPKYVENTNAEPVAFSCVTKAFSAPFSTVWKAPEVVGKLLVFVVPATYAFPAKTAMPFPWLNPVPPKYVTYTSPLPAGLSLATKASWHGVVLGGVPQVFRVVWNASAVAKFVEEVKPVT